MTGKRRAGRDPVQPPTPRASPSQPPVVIAPQVSRRQARLARKKQQRRRVGFAGGAAIVVAVIVVVAAGAFGIHKAVTSGGGPSRSQTTVLLQLKGTDGSATASALLAHNTDGNTAVEVLIPSRIITDVCGYNSLDFGNILGLPAGDSVSRQSLSAMLDNVTVDGSWVLTPAQLTKLVTLVGGITVDVDVNVVQPTGGGGGRILVPAGPNEHLNGAQALEYATYSSGVHADASLQLARLQQVIDATAQALPTTTTAIGALLRQLGPGGASTLGTGKLAPFLQGFAIAQNHSGSLFPTDFPSTVIDTGGAPSYRVDATGAKQLVNAHLKESLPSDAGRHRPTVELLNGVGTPGLIATTCPKLAAHRLMYAGSQNAAEFNQPASTILVSNANISLGYQVADALKLPHGDVRRSSQNQTIADVIVTLGRDYRP